MRHDARKAGIRQKNTWHQNSPANCCIHSRASDRLTPTSEAEDPLGRFNAQRLHDDLVPAEIAQPFNDAARVFQSASPRPLGSLASSSTPYQGQRMYGPGHSSSPWSIRKKVRARMSPRRGGIRRRLIQRSGKRYSTAICATSTSTVPIKDTSTGYQSGKYSPSHNSWPTATPSQHESSSLRNPQANRQTLNIFSVSPGASCSCLYWP